MDWDDPAKYFYGYWYLVISIVGLIDNSLMLLVFSKQNLAKYSVSIYFRAIAVSNLIMSVLFVKIFVLQIFDYQLEEQSEFFCKSLIYLFYSTSCLSGWFQVAAGLNRLAIILFPTKFGIFKNTNFARLSILLILLFNLVLYSHLFADTSFVVVVSGGENTLDVTYYDSNITNDTISSTFSDKNCNANISPLYFTLDFVNTAALPSAIMLASTIATITGVCLFHKRTREQSGSSQKIEARDIKFSITLIVLNIIFLVFKISDVILFFTNVTDAHNNLNDNAYAILGFIYDILQSLFYTTGFLIQLITNSLVRNEFYRLFDIF